MHGCVVTVAVCVAPRSGCAWVGLVYVRVFVACLDVLYAVVPRLVESCLGTAVCANCSSPRQ